ncbi:MAG: hypothetical protein HOW73_46870 [Polyangiaceae bacterium]|nr:hypothetical protein [Polyangiaceae bacterium]
MKHVVSSSLGILMLGALLAACNEDTTETQPEPEPEPEPECVANADCTDASKPYCEPDLEACDVAPAGGAIGWGDGSSGSVTFTKILSDNGLREPTDLAFHPDRPEIWVVNHKDDSVVVITNPGDEAQTSERYYDEAAMHFMHKPPALAFGAANTWATCGDGDNGGDDFMGPALFTADLSIFAKSTPGGLGSHLDMLHSTSFCRGIAHEADNVYWVFNSDKASIDRYDFHADHGPGNDDHSDGEIYRYAKGAVAGADGIPSHVFFLDGMLYIADTGNKRIAKLDPSTATMGTTFGGFEPVTRRNMEGAVVTDVVPAGTLEAPSGIEIHDGVIYVSDSAQGRFYAFDMEGTLLRTLDTGAAPGSLAGMAFGPDGKLYFTDVVGSTVYRIDPR